MTAANWCNGCEDSTRPLKETAVESAATLSDVALSNDSVGKVVQRLSLALERSTLIMGRFCNGFARRGLHFWGLDHFIRIADHEKCNEVLE
jgi:hypothetical protein